MKKTRRLAVSILICLSITAAALTASASVPIKVYENGTEVSTEASPRFVEGQVMIPFHLAEELFERKLSYDPVNRVMNVNDNRAQIAQSEDGLFSITGTEERDGMWDRLRLTTNDREVSVPGKALGLDSYAPEFVSASLTGGDKSDLVVLLTQGYGTGVYINEAVVYTEDLHQVPLEDGAVALLKQFNSKQQADGSIEIQAGGVSTVVSGDRLFTNVADRGDRASIGSVLRYEVNDNILSITAGVLVGTSEFIGDMKLDYTYQNGVLQAGKAVFTPYEEYR
ncbi:hypothetical protein [Saccharibacillus sp. JS10]|uniref:hypothetical protein n=1 Tax=Saccharibacillus sp. JS10 TaxID=2950552 RepID=UPI00210A099A|nr:hypothetical protein [Saccharibacillus sp. JS10]MCQ4088032.1 hypothetical protein [Saccharibacillus sp. JS10]